MDPARGFDADVLLYLIQSDRRAAGVSPLLTYAPLTEVAYAHAQDMARRGYVGDVTPEGVSLVDQVRRHDRRSLYSAFGVNIARMSTAGAMPDLHDAIMSTSENARNVLRDSFGHVGVATFVSSGQVYVVQVFARVEGALGRPLPETASSDFLVTAQYASEEMAPVSWSITAADGTPVRQGRGQRLRPADLRDVEGYLSLDVAMGPDIYKLKGPYLKVK